MQREMFGDKTRRDDASETHGGAAVDAEECLRADFYDFLSGLLARPPEPERLKELARLGRVRDGEARGGQADGGEADGDEIGAQIRLLAERARAMDARSVDREFHALFIGLGRGELLPSASYYMTGFLNEKPLARLRRDMRRLRMERAPSVFEPEDNIASLFEMMGGLIRGRYGAPADLETQREFFNTHLAPWAEHFFGDLEQAEAARFYAPVGALGRLLANIEREAFRMEGAASSDAGGNGGGSTPRT